MVRAYAAFRALPSKGAPSLYLTPGRNANVHTLLSAFVDIPLASAGDGVCHPRRVRAARLATGPAGDEPAVPERAVRLLGDEGDARPAEQRPARPDAVRRPGDLLLGRQRGEGEIPAAAGRGRAGHPAHVRVLHGPAQGARTRAAEPAATSRAEAENRGKGLLGLCRRHLHPEA